MDNKYQKVILNNIDVWCVIAEGVKGSAKAFNKLESILPTLKGRHFYGVLNGKPDNGTYRACVVKQLDENFGNLESWVIPGGKYARAKIKNWEENIQSIAQEFSQMTKEFAIDKNRPCIEFYKSQEELILMLPIQ